MTLMLRDGRGVKLQDSIIQPGYPGRADLGESLHEHGQVSLLFEVDPDAITLDLDGPGIGKELGIETLGGLPLMAGKHEGDGPVEVMGGNGEGEVEIDLHHNGGREAVQVKEVDVLRDPFLNEPAPSVLADDLSDIPLSFVGEEKGWFLPAVTGEDELAEGMPEPRELDERVVDVDSRVLAVGASEDELLPAGGSEGSGLGKELLASSSEGDELNPVTIELDQVLVGGEA